MAFASDAQRRWWFAQLDDNAVRGQQPIPDEVRRYSDQLSPEAREVLRGYNVNGKHINDAINEGLQADFAQMGALDRIIEAAPESDVTVYRGVPLMPVLGPEGAGLSAKDRDELVRERLADLAESRYQPGNVITLGKGYQSASFIPEPAMDASGTRQSPGLIFEVVASKGVLLPAQGMLYDDELEYLMPRNTRYRVLRVLRDVTFEMADERQMRRTVVQVKQEYAG